MLQKHITHLLLWPSTNKPFYNVLVRIHGSVIGYKLQQYDYLLVPQWPSISSDCLKPFLWLDFFTVTHNHDPRSLCDSPASEATSHVAQLLKQQPHSALSRGLPAFWGATLHRALNNLATALICRYYLGLYNFAKVILLSDVMEVSTCLALPSSTAAARLPLQSLLLRSILSFSLGLPLILQNLHQLLPFYKHSLIYCIQHFPYKIINSDRFVLHVQNQPFLKKIIDRKREGSITRFFSPEFKKYYDL